MEEPLVLFNGQPLEFGTAVEHGDLIITENATKTRFIFAYSEEQPIIRSDSEFEHYFIAKYGRAAFERWISENQP